ncbi:helix-turn-helix transcriptional regulator [Paenibacillus sp. CMAA1364]
MDMIKGIYPLQRQASFREWSPNIHYAQFQRMPTGVLPERRLYNFELLYLVQGQAATTIYGQRFDIIAGQLLFLPSGVLHQNEVVSTPDASFLGIHFDFFDELNIATEADMIVNEENIHLNKFALEPCSENFTSLSSQVVYTIPLACIQLMEKLVHEFTMRPLGYELVCRALILNILAHLLRISRSISLTHTSPYANKISRIMGKIELNPSGDWCNHSIAEELQLSIDYTAKLFKQTAGMPPNEFIQSIRHREARKLLRETDMTVEEIGEHVGYPDIHYFSRLFRRQEGIPASEYRKLSRIL